MSMITNELLLTEHSKVRQQWNKSLNDVLQDIQILKEWCESQQHFPEIPDDNMLEFFITNCKYSIEKAKKNIDMYYTLTPLIPEVYEKGNPNLSDYQEKVENCGMVVTMPKLTKSLQRITMYAFKEDSTHFDPMMMVAHQLNVYEIRTHVDLVMGEILIMDGSNVKLGHVVKYTQIVFKTMVLILQDIMRNRVKEIHIINYPQYVHIVMAVAKGTLKKKLYDRIYLHKNLESLYKHISPEVLPKDYGGKQKSMDELNELWKEEFVKWSDRFDKKSKMRVNEGLRPVPLENSEILGYYGNFKKLDVD
ncbi:alpha-tocopherol transfer protein-like [Diabrotica undecimpunctata]|uniref:alpha-tocopherol transfer protein-like n=1 Tax=Diabrotica undecimpunctata TaxID=50387 RepID=UPI003B63D1A5